MRKKSQAGEVVLNLPAESRLEFRISSDAKRQIERAAAAQGRSISDFAKETLLQRAQVVLESFEVVQLSDRERDIFLQLLDADPAPNAALNAAGRRQRAMIIE